MMTHTYKISGMTCAGCQTKIQSLLSKVKGVKDATVNLTTGEAVIDMQQHVPATDLQAALKAYPNYELSDIHQHHDPVAATEVETQKSWIEAYKPILLVFAYISGVTLLVEAVNNSFHWMRWMNHFMAGFFLVFSFFKLLDVKAFAESYSTYDIIAKKWFGWGYVYAFVELALGIAYLLNFIPWLVNAITFAVMTVSIIGVLQSVLNKRKIRCACLGAVFNLPMSTVTIFEDALMISMSAIMFIIII